MKTCKICGCSFDDDNCCGVVVNEGMDTECPSCGKDVVECVSREEFEEEHFLSKYSVVVKMGNYSRGYVISAQNPTDMMKKLMKRAELCSAAEIIYSEILIDEDVIK